MATSIGTAWIQIKPSLKGVSKDIENQLRGASLSGGGKIEANLRGVFNKLGSNIRSTFSSAFENVTSYAKNILTAGIGGAVGLMTAQIGSAVSRIDTLKNAPRVFQAMGYSAGDVSTAMGSLDKYLKGLPTSLDDAVRSVQTLSASFGGIKNGERYFRAMNNAGLAFGASSEMIRNAIYQLSQTSLDGPLDAATWNSLRNSGFQPVFAAMADQMGITVGELKEQFGGKGTRTVKEFMDKLVELDEKGGKNMSSLSAMARANTDGIATSFTNMRTAVTRSISKVIEGIPNLTQSITGVGEAVEGVLSGKLSTDDAAKKIGDFIRNIASGIGTVIEKLLPVILPSLVALVTSVAERIAKYLSDNKNSSQLIRGFVQLFVAVAKAGAQIALAIIPLIPEIVSTIANEFTKPENAGTLAAGMGILLGAAAAKTLAGNGLKMVGQSISDLFGKMLGNSKQLTDAADGIDKLSSAAKKAPKEFTFGKSMANFFKEMGTLAGGAIQGAWKPVTEFFKGAGETVAGFFKALASPDVLIGVLSFTAAAAGVAAAILLIGGALGIVSPGLRDFLNMVIIPLAAFLAGTFLVVIGGITDAIVRLTQEAVIPLVNAVAGGLTDVFNSIGGVIEKAGDSISKVVDSISNGISKVIDSITRLISSVGGQDWYGTGYGITRNFTAGLLDGMIDLLQDSLNKVINNIINIPGIGNALKAVGVKANPVNLSGFKLGKRAQGGAVFGPGGPTSDSIPMLLSNGEYVIRASSARKIGYDKLNDINRTGSAGNTLYQTININGYNRDPKELANEISRIIALRKGRVMG
jgi:tape measure domain-containing protein